MSQARGRGGASSRRRDDAARREEITARLEEIFLAEGFSSLTFDDLCRRLHCSKTTLYLVAATREQIIQRVTRRFFQKSTEVIEAAIAGTEDPAERIVRYLAGVGAAMSRNSRQFYEDMVSYEPTAAIYRLNARAAARPRLSLRGRRGIPDRSAVTQSRNASSC
ncbi:hypothetical protein SAMN05443637_11564 [Pseudonocardia thermophila]|uniref:Transcriptional regulator, TetR family n=1 Tax=Pseudonocardia thermophila TaxID=1848 RepID=A0A1M6WRP0_PSETH|nr:TetR/AcrR family transcriptional regulator [Pseudonocardia thermophila]SHK96336.1 hypothetical protein SAMN05443637_11564 [Pseudonocardia thermophila]